MRSTASPPSPSSLGCGLAVAILCVLARPVVAEETTPRADERPNILLVYVDDLRHDALSATGETGPRTPALDRLASEGALFENAFVTTSLCSPSRAALLSSRHAHEHGVWGNTGRDLAPSIRTFPLALREAGYETAWIGKWHMAHHARPRAGFDHWVSFVGQGAYFDNELDVDGETEQSRGYVTDVLTDKALEFLRRDRRKPFCLVVSHKAVHHPFTPAPRHADLALPTAVRSRHLPGDRLADKLDWGRRVPATWREDIARYRRSVAAIDESFARLLDALDELDIARNTCVVFTSDNGYLHGEHGGLWDKRAAYEPSIRVPLLLRLPGRVPAGARVADMALEIDLGPTFLELAGVRPPDGFRGRSLLGLLGAGSARAPRDAFLYEYFRERDPAFDRPSVLAVRTTTHKYITYPDRPDAPVEAYDLVSDPDELRNIARSAEHAPVVASLARRLDELVAETGFRFPAGVPRDRDRSPKTTTPARNERPNVVYILADDLGWSELGCYGQTRIRTPSIDRLAREGMRFTQHYSGSPVCAPSRCVLLTGLHTGHAYVRDNYELGGWTRDAREGQLPLPAGTVTLGTILQGMGYRTGAIGKWGLGGPDTTGHPNLQGFDHFYGYLCQRVAHNYYPTHLWRNTTRHVLANDYFAAHQRLEGDPADPSSYERFRGTEYSMDLMAREARRFIRENRERPFFLYLPFPVPHVSLQVPEDSLTEYAGEFPETPYGGEKGYLPHPTPRAAYAAMITRMDREIGRIVDLLEELDLDERTIVLFSSDNGPTFNGGSDSAFFRSAGELRGLKCDVWEGGIRVPFIARWPGRIAAGATSDLVCGFQDVLPTVAELCGAHVPGGLDGVSLVPTLLGTGTQRQHDHLYWEYHSRGGMQAARKGRWKAVRLGLRESPSAPIRLFDLVEDPGETTDLAARHPEVVAEMARILSARHESPIEAWNFRPLEPAAREE